MFKAVDSSSGKPTPALVAAFKAEGFMMWNGYIATRPDVNLLAPWSQDEFDIARTIMPTADGQPIAYYSGWDDPVAVKALAAQWNVRPCLDVESGIRGDGTWVQGNLIASGGGLYGNEPVFSGRTAAFYVLADYPGGADPTATWAPRLIRPRGPCGWQWHGGIPMNGINVDLSWFDDWFLGGKVSYSNEVANKLIMQPGTQDGYIVDLWGGMHPVGAMPPAQGAPYWPHWNNDDPLGIVADAALAPNGSGGYVMDRWGGIHAFSAKGAAPPKATGTPYWSGHDLAQTMVVVDFARGHGYTLDGWGGLHPWAGTPPLDAHGAYWPGGAF